MRSSCTIKLCKLIVIFSISPLLIILIAQQANCHCGLSSALCPIHFTCSSSLPVRANQLSDRITLFRDCAESVKLPVDHVSGGAIVFPATNNLTALTNKDSFYHPGKGYRYHVCLCSSFLQSRNDLAILY